MSDKEAWEYVIRNEDLIWSSIWSNNVPISFQEDILSEARIRLVKRLPALSKKYGIEYISEHLDSIVESSVLNSMAKLKNNARDYNHLVKRGIINEVKRSKKKVIIC